MLVKITSGVPKQVEAELAAYLSAVVKEQLVSITQSSASLSNVTFENPGKSRLELTVIIVTA